MQAKPPELENGLEPGEGMRLVGVGKRFGRAGKVALEDVSLSVARGEILGIVGSNGSGKTTLLRLIAGVSAASAGEIRLCGPVAALLDLSGGFHPHLNGWQNLYLGASLAGLGRRQVEERLGSIVEFSGLSEGDMGRPVREWSSGMVARLGFSIAVGVDPEIVVVDEVLAVGDAAFQTRCAKRLLDFRKAGKTMVMVSHLTSMLKDVADRMLWLEGGRVRMLGPVREVADAYEGWMRRRINDHRLAAMRGPLTSGVAAPVVLEIVGGPGVEREPDTPHWAAVVECAARPVEPWAKEALRGSAEPLWLYFRLETRWGVLLDEGWLPVEPDGEFGPDGARAMKLRLGNLALVPGTYDLALALCRGAAAQVAPGLISDLPPALTHEVAVKIAIPGQWDGPPDYPVLLPVEVEIIDVEDHGLNGKS